MPIEQALISPKEVSLNYAACSGSSDFAMWFHLFVSSQVSEDFIAKFRDERALSGRSNSRVRKCQGDVAVNVIIKRSRHVRDQPNRASRARISEGPLHQRPQPSRRASQSSASSYLPICCPVATNPHVIVSDFLSSPGKRTRYRQLLETLPLCWRDENGQKVFHRRDLQQALQQSDNYDGWMEDNRDCGTTLYELHHIKGLVIPFGNRSGKYRVTEECIEEVRKLA